MNIYDKAKDAANILRQADKIDEYRAILDLLDDLMNKREQISKMDTTIKALEEKLRTSNDYFFQNNAYYHKETKDGPYCSRCFDKDKHLIRIIPRKSESRYATCPECKNEVNYSGKADESKVHIYNPHLNSCK